MPLPLPLLIGAPIGCGWGRRARSLASDATPPPLEIVFHSSSLLLREGITDLHWDVNPITFLIYHPVSVRDKLENDGNDEGSLNLVVD